MRNLSLLILILITLLIFSTPLTVKARGRRLIAVYEDGRDFPTGWGMFDVKEVRLYQEPNGDYILELIPYKPLRTLRLIGVSPIFIDILIDYDSNESTSMLGSISGGDYRIFILLPITAGKSLWRNLWP